MKQLSTQQRNDLLLGACLLATGGGCTYKEKQTLLANTPMIQIIDGEELEPDATICTLYAVGPTSIQTSDIKEQVLLGIQAVEKLAYKKLAGLFVGEIGGEQLALYTAGLMRIPVIDADGTGGRAVPEITQDQFALYDRFTTPAVTVDTNGTIRIFENLSPEMLEQEVRTLATKTQNLVFVFDHIMRASEIGLLNQGSLKRSLALGQILRERNFVLLKSLGVDIIDEVTVTSVETQDDADFLRATVTMRGVRGFYELRIQNENLVLKRNNTPIVTCPNLIMLLDQDGQPVHNGNLKNVSNARVTVLAARATSGWQSEKGALLFGPRRFGFGFDPVFNLS